MLVAALAAATAASGGGRASSPAPAVRIATDPFVTTAAQHATAVEPDTYAFGDTVVAVFQVGRFSSGGAAGIGFATSTDAGRTWRSGLLPRLTRFSRPAAGFDRVSDPSVAYDSIHAVWLVSILAINGDCVERCTSSLLVSRSRDGLSWDAPLLVSSPTNVFRHDKNWVACDNWASSPFAGRCYTSWSDVTREGRIVTQTSVDGGVTWGAPVASPDLEAAGVGAQPVVQPSGQLVIPFRSLTGSPAAVRSHDGGSSFGPRILIATSNSHRPTGMRASPLPSVEVDGGGTIYVAWHDCRFRPRCAANDIVLSTSADGGSWTAPARVPTDPVTSGADHFIPGIGVDPSTAGASARVAIAYYFFPTASCRARACRLQVGLIESGNGGRSWSRAVRLNPRPIALTSIATTTIGRMVGDYISTSFARGTAVPVFVHADPPLNGRLREAVWTRSITAAGPAPAPPASAPVVVSRVAASPGRPRAGAVFTATVRVVALGAALPHCSARVGGRRLRAVARRLTAAGATCSWKIPAGARGQRVRGAVGARYGGDIGGATFSLRVQ